jgi:heptosyltransferase-3
MRHVKEGTFENVLIVRTDRIGDVILTLPMILVLRKNVPGSRISMLLRSYTKGLVEGFAGLDAILTYDTSGVQKGWFAILAELRARRFDLAVVSHPTFRIAALLYCAGVPVRVGSGYRWYSFLFNRKVFEHRKTAEKHEAEYNTSLLQAIGLTAPEVPRISLAIPESSKFAAASEIRRLGIAPSEKFVVLHPGSGGSARDWSAENFGDLAQELVRIGFRVVVTGSTDEAELVERVHTSSGGVALSSAGRMPLKDLAAFIGEAQLFVSNSTGPLHIAAAVGTPVIAFYPPIRECSARRWGPLTDDKIVFTADNALCRRCKGGACQGNDCMGQIKVADVLEAARSLLISR